MKRDTFKALREMMGAALDNAKGFTSTSSGWACIVDGPDVNTRGLNIPFLANKETHVQGHSDRFGYNRWIARLEERCFDLMVKHRAQAVAIRRTDVEHMLGAYPGVDDLAGLATHLEYRRNASVCVARLDDGELPGEFVIITFDWPLEERDGRVRAVGIAHVETLEERARWH